MMVQAAKDVAAKEVQYKAQKAQAQRARFLLACAFHTLKDVAAISRVLRHGDWPQQRQSSSRGRAPRCSPSGPGW